MGKVFTFFIARITLVYVVGLGAAGQYRIYHDKSIDDLKTFNSVTPVGELVLDLAHCITAVSRQVDHSGG